MSRFSRIPGLRILERTIEYINRPAPLNEFRDYDEYWQVRAEDGLTERKLDRFVTIANLIEDGESVLDIGCGDGSFQTYLASSKARCPSLGLDVSEKAVELATARGIRAQVINPGLRLKDQVRIGWDVITLMEVIEHVVDAEELLRQVAELKPKRLFVKLPNVGCLKHRLRLMFGARFPITTIVYHMKEHVRFWTTKDFEQWSNVMGFSVKAVYGQFGRGDSIVQWCTRKYPALFAEQVIYELNPSHTESSD